MHRLMIVDDEKNVLTALQRLCRAHTSWEIETYSQPEAALKRAQSANFDLFLTDYRMPKMNGAKFLSEIKLLQPKAMRIILSGQTDRKGLLKAINDAEIYRFIEKPWLDDYLLAAIRQALDFHDILLENSILADQVREQQTELTQRKLALEKYKLAHPDLLFVDWDDDGSVILNENQ